jgi:hypothetical protein
VPTKRRGAWGAGVGVVLAAASGALINELQAGWPWWVAAALVVLASAVLTGWLASAGPPSAASGSGTSGSGTSDQRAADGQPQGVPTRIGPGAMRAGRDIKIRGNLKTSGPRINPPISFGSREGDTGPGLDVQGLDAGRDVSIGGDVDTTGDDNRS